MGALLIIMQTLTDPLGGKPPALCKLQKHPFHSLYYKTVHIHRPLMSLLVKKNQGHILSDKISSGKIFV